MRLENNVVELRLYYKVVAFFLLNQIYEWFWPMMWKPGFHIIGFDDAMVIYCGIFFTKKVALNEKQWLFDYFV